MTQPPDRCRRAAAGRHPAPHRPGEHRPRRLVVLCDISGSMARYARAMLQLLYCAVGGSGAEVSTFATRLTRLSRVLRLAYRMVWANPRTASPYYQPLAGGMAAAWPYCDTVVSAHHLAALDELIEAVGRAPRGPARSDAGARRVAGGPR